MPKRTIIVPALALAVIALPHLALAGGAAGGTMPYSSFLTTFRGSITGEVAGIICMIAIVSGVATYIFASAFDGILLAIVRVVIGIAIVGGAAAFLTTAGVAGAIV
jgi:type IV secretory pathway VirB2 component (pilin)